jgi:hypothetical protein
LVAGFGLTFQLDRFKDLAESAPGVGRLWLTANGGLSVGEDLGLEGVESADVWCRDACWFRDWLGWFFRAAREE